MYKKFEIFLFIVIPKILVLNFLAILVVVSLSRKSMIYEILGPKR